MSSFTSPQHLLAIVPFAEPIHKTSPIRKQNPAMKITWLHQKVHPLEAWTKDFAIDPQIYKDVTVLFTLRALPDPDQAPHLHYVHVFSAGTNHLSNHPLYKDPTITMTTSSGSHGPQIAEWVMMIVLANNHRLREMNRWQAERKWGAFPDHFERVRDLCGQRIGVLGYGSIGRQVARVARAFGMDVVAYTATPRLSAESKKDRAYVAPGTGDADGIIPSAWFSGLNKASLHAFLAERIDTLVISLPSTKQTYHLIGEEELEILGRTNHAFISNVGRGEILDLNALTRILKRDPLHSDSWLRGAALDVTEPEPLPADSELWGMENVTITPHVSGAAVGYVERAVEMLGINIERGKKGEGMLNVVERERGY